MKIAQYMRQEKAITAADIRGIRERWLWGLRILRDPEKISESGKSLKHGVVETLLARATKLGYKLNEREIQRRIQCARTYKTEDEIRQALTDFETWDELLNAGFPAYEAPPDEPPADHRTDDERRHDQARALVDRIGEQGALFPMTEFEPSETTLKELQDYTEQQEELTHRFVQHDRKRRAYLDSLIKAVDDDLDATWQEAHDQLPEDEEAEDDEATDEDAA